MEDMNVTATGYDFRPASIIGTSSIGADVQAPNGGFRLTQIRQA